MAQTSFNEIGADGYGNDRCSSKSRALSSAAKLSSVATKAKVDDGDAGDAPQWGALSMEEILHLIMTQLSVGPEVAGPALSLGRSSTYRACRKGLNGPIPARKIGNKFIIATSWLRQVLGLEPTSMPVPASLPATNTVTEPTKPKQVTKPKRRRRPR